MEFMPEHAPLVVMAFLGTVALLGLALLAILIAFVTRKRWLAIAAAAFACLLACVYLLALVSVSLTSHEKLLALGERKYFCEIDCHIAYSIEGVQESAALGDELRQLPAHGRFIIVGLKSWFDPSTISPHRGNGQLTPNSRRVLLIDDSGHSFAPSDEAQSVLAKISPPSTPLTQPLRPGDSYITDFVFDLPSTAHNPRLFVGDGYDYPDKLLIGHEDSFLHNKIYLALNPADRISAGGIP